MLDQFITQWTTPPNQVPVYKGDTAHAGQCYQLFNFYNRDVVHAPDFLRPYAYQIYTEFTSSPLEPFYDRLELTSGFVMQYGDVPVWSPQLPGSGGAGHVDMCNDHHATPLQFTSFASNWEGKYAHQVTHNYDYVLGVLRPKGKTMSRYDTVPTREDIKAHYQKRLFRDATEAELANKDKRTWGQILDDNVTELGARFSAEANKPATTGAAVTRQAALDYVNQHLQ